MGWFTKDTKEELIIQIDFLKSKLAEPLYYKPGVFDTEWSMGLTRNNDLMRLKILENKLRDLVAPHGEED